MTYLPLPPMNWPQDRMQIPAGVGGMPPVEWANSNVDGAECSFLAGEITIPAAAPVGSIFNLFLPTDQDGDLWVSQIFVNSNRLKGGSVVGTFLPSLLSISDARTGKNLTYPGPAPILYFASGASFEESQYNVAQTPLPSGYRTTGTLIQPFCFTRHGGALLQLQTVQVNTSAVFTVSFALAGWKEYANASR